MVSKAGILERLIEPGDGNFSVEHARYIHGLDFSPDQHARYAEIFAKAEQGRLNPGEESELDEFLAVNSLLMLLQSKARISLQNHSLTA